MAAMLSEQDLLILHYRAVIRAVTVLLSVTSSRC